MRGGGKRKGESWRGEEGEEEVERRKLTVLPTGYSREANVRNIRS